MQRNNKLIFLLVFTVLAPPAVAGCQERGPKVQIEQPSSDAIREVEPPEEVIAPITEDLKVVSGEPATTVEEGGISDEGQTADKKTGSVAMKTEY